MSGPYITNIQRYSIHDGPGIRTTVFFKGCPLRCAWCHNPETQSFELELMSGADGCKVCGKSMSVESLVTELMKDIAFYETSGGGVTFSGGEVLAQDMEYVVRVMQSLKNRGINTAVDTCGDVPYENIRAVLPFTDIFLYDIKLMDAVLHEKYAGHGNARILDNLKTLSKEGAVIWIRVPVIGTVNDSDENFSRMADFLKENDIRYGQIDLLPYHDTGSSKYPRLGRTYTGADFSVPSGERLCDIRSLLDARGAGPVM